MARRGRTETIATSDLPREVIEACCTNHIEPVRAWLKKGSLIDAKTGLPDLMEGADVTARFHGGDEFYPATVTKSNGSTYSLEYKEHGMVWGEYETCPREEIRLAGSTVRAPP